MFRIELIFVQGNGADNMLFIPMLFGQQSDDFKSIKNFDTFIFYIFCQCFKHEMRSQRSRRSRPLPGIMIGFIADKSAVAIVWKCYAKAHEMEKRLGSIHGFAQCNIAMHTAAFEQVFCHIHRRIGLIACQG